MITSGRDARAAASASSPVATATGRWPAIRSCPDSTVRCTRLSSTSSTFQRQVAGSGRNRGRPSGLGVVGVECLAQLGERGGERFGRRRFAAESLLDRRGFGADPIESNGSAQAGHAVQQLHRLGLRVSGRRWQAREFGERLAVTGEARDEILTGRAQYPSEVVGRGRGRFVRRPIVSFRCD